MAENKISFKKDDKDILTQTSGFQSDNSRSVHVLTSRNSKKYRIEQTVGSGGMKTICQAEDRDIGRKVAIAEMRPKLNGNESKINRFIQEARITANLEHPNIVPVHELGKNSDNSPYFVMKMLSGEPLSMVIDKLKNKTKGYAKKYNLHHRLRIFIKICNAVAFAHSKGIIHLDIKPDNIQIGDFGEVLLLDWGLAKISNDPKNIQNPKKGKSKDQKERDLIKNTTKELSNSILDITLDGVIKGTPGYMAPEQVYGKNKEKDTRTDIYALGAVLYFLLTFQRPVEGKTIQALMVSTLNAKISPPSERVPQNHIPKALNAVTLKALAFKKENRYQKVNDLIRDIDSFLGGYATTAERAGIFTRLALMLRRHKAFAISTALFLFTLIMFIAYFTANYYSQWGNWREVYSCKFSDNNINENDFSFTDAYNKKQIGSWVKNSYGLQMHKDEWLWLKNIKIRGDCRVTAKILCSGTLSPVIISLNAEKKQLSHKTFVPPGYSFVFGAWNGRRNLISKNSTSSYPTPLGFTSASTFSIDRIHTLTVEKKKENISFFVDGKKSLSVIDFFPPIGREQNNIGLKTQSPAMTLISIKVYRWAIPEKPLPTITGDVLVEYKHFNEAVAKYMQIAEDTKDKETAALALLKAYMTSSSYNIFNQERTLSKIKNLMHNNYERTVYDIKISEQEILYNWEKKHYRKAFSLLPELFKKSQKTQIIPKILQLKHENPPDYVTILLLQWLKKTEDPTEINISGLNIQSLEELKGMKIISLNCSRNPIKNLNALKQMNLLRLNCSSCNLDSISPLQGMKIEELIISNNNISDLSPITGMPLKRFRCRLNKISSLTPLIGMKLERLECGGNMITTLSALKNMNLKVLGCRKNQIKSLAPLKGMKLLILDCQENPIEKIDTLAGMPLRELFLNGCHVTNLKPLQYCPSLEKLTIPEEAIDIKFLQKLPDLKYLSRNWNIILPESKIFWKKINNNGKNND